MCDIFNNFRNNKDIIYSTNLDEFNIFNWISNSNDGIDNN